MGSWGERRQRALDDLRAIATERAKLDDRELVAVLHARECSLDWTSIALALGISRTVAHRRYSPQEPAPMWGHRARRGRRPAGK